jgi:predicted transcriptional regulator
MQPHYRTLLVIYEIVKNDPQPTTYLCRPRELILRQMTDWSIIQDHLSVLKSEELITTKQMDTMVISITLRGIEKITSFIHANVL